MTGLVAVTLRGQVILHRPYPGSHDDFAPDCWCRPTVIERGDPRSTPEILSAIANDAPRVN